MDIPVFQQEAHDKDDPSVRHRPHECIVALYNYSGSFLLVMTLSYGLIRVPKSVWERRNLSITLGYLYFNVKELQDCKRDAMYALETQYAV